MRYREIIEDTSDELLKQAERSQDALRLLHSRQQKAADGRDAAMDLAPSETRQRRLDVAARREREARDSYNAKLAQIEMSRRKAMAKGASKPPQTPDRPSCG